MHPRLAELLAYLDAQRARVVGAASDLPPERWGVRPAPDRWSVAEVYWHLQRVEQGVAKLIRKRATEAREQGIPAEQETSSALGALDHARLADRSWVMFAPPQVSPPAEIPSAEMVQQQLEESRQMLRAAVAEADGLALGSVRHPHPLLGEIDLYQWILFVGQHEGRHAVQIEEAAKALARS
ncbi:MAG: DinB family protein [Gemmatimonadaceae bacterium]